MVNRLKGKQMVNPPIILGNQKEKPGN